MKKSITRPSRDSMLTFEFPAKVAGVLVRGGQRVKKGDKLIQADDEELRFQVELQQLVADSDLEVRRAQNAVDQAKIEFDAQIEIKAKGGGSKIDYDRSDSLLKQRVIELDLAKLNRRQQALQLQRAQKQLDRFVIVAPFDGRVDIVLTDAGEVKRETDQIVRIVNNDPLWIDVPVEAPASTDLVINGQSWVLMDLPGEPKVWPGRIIEIGAEVDAASNSRRVRVEVSNPQDIPSGLRAWARFSPPTGEWAGRVQTLAASPTSVEAPATPEEAEARAARRGQPLEPH
jgi:RND family efflux transporter MFP subunit